MGKLEHLSPIWTGGAIVTDEDSVVAQSADERTELNFPLKVKPYLDGIKKGQSIYQIVQTEYSEGRQLQFSWLFRVLDELCAHGFIRNVSQFERFLSEVRGEFQWDEPIIKKDLWSSPLIDRFAGPKMFLPFGAILSLLVIFLSGLYAPQLFGFWKHLVKNSQAFLLVGPGFWKPLVFIYLASSVSLSLQSMLYWLLHGLSTGLFPKLETRWNLLGFYLSADLSRAGRGFFPLLATVAAGLSLLLLVPIVLGLGITFKLGNDALLVLWLLFLVQMSPVAHSYFTHALALFFNSSRNAGKKREDLLHSIQLVGVLVWLALIGGLLFLALPAFFKSALLILQAKVLVECLSILAMGLFLVLILGSLASDIYDFFASSPGRGQWFWQKQEVEKSKHKPKEILAKTPPFKFMSPEILETIAERSYVEQKQRGDVLCAIGKHERDMFILIEGQVAVFKRSQLKGWKKLVELGEGSVFGEVGFFSGEPRTATVAAAGPCTVLRIRFDRDNADLALSGERFQFLKDRIWLMQTLNTADVFKELPAEALEGFLAYGQVVDVTGGQCLIREGDAPNGFYLTIQGQLRATKNAALLREMGRGDIFGEIALLYNLKRTATVTSSTDCKILQVSREDFWKILGDNIGLGLFIERVAKSRLQNT